MISTRATQFPHAYLFLPPANEQKAVKGIGIGGEREAERQRGRVERGWGFCLAYRCQPITYIPTPPPFRASSRATNTQSSTWRAFASSAGKKTVGTVVRADGIPGLAAKTNIPEMNLPSTTHYPRPTTTLPTASLGFRGRKIAREETTKGADRASARPKFGVSSPPPRFLPASPKRFEVMP